MEVQPAGRITHPSQNPAYAALQLSDLQADQIDGIHAEVQRRLEPLREQMKRLRREFLDLFGAATTDRRTLELKIGEMSAVQEQIEKVVADSLLQEKNILSPEQQGALLKLLERRFKQEDHHGTGTMTPYNTIPERAQPDRKPEAKRR
jgi:Spy/CpxP family protein refolding chaperone